MRCKGSVLFLNVQVFRKEIYGKSEKNNKKEARRARPCTYLPAPGSFIHLNINPRQTALGARRAPPPQKQAMH